VVTWLGENNDGLEDILRALCKVHCYSLRHDLGFRLIINKSCRGGRKIKRLFPSACLEEDVVLASRLFISVGSGYSKKFWLVSKRPSDAGLR
jgi:hypothetical protein